LLFKSTENDASFFTTFTYIDLPVLAGYTFSPDNVSFSLITGLLTE